MFMSPPSTTLPSAVSLLPSVFPSLHPSPAASCVGAESPVGALHEHEHSTATRPSAEEGAALRRAEERARAAEARADRADWAARRAEEAAEAAEADAKGVRKKAVAALAIADRACESRLATMQAAIVRQLCSCLLYTSPSPRDS